MAVGYEVLAVRYGTRETRRSEVFLNFDVYGQPDGPIAMDYFFWVIRNEERTIVVDTGYKPEVGERRKRTLLADPADLARDLGLTSGPAPLVVVTHFHYDHIGNLSLFGSSEIVAGADEASFWFGPYADRLQLAYPTETDELDYLRDRRANLILVSGTKEIAPGVTVHQVGGHTPGQLMVTVDGGPRRIVLTSDAAHYREEVERDWPFSFVAGLPEMYAGFAKIRELVRDGAVFVPGHDPLVAEEFPVLAGTGSGLVHVIS